MVEPDIELQVLKLAVKVLTEELDSFISCCRDENGQPKAPRPGELARACSFLPPPYKNSFRKRDENISKTGSVSN